MECLEEWAAWAAWAAWECNPHYTQTKIQKGQFLLPFFLFILKSLVMKSDEGFSNMSDKSILNQLVNENVISPTKRF